MLHLPRYSFPITKAALRAGVLAGVLISPAMPRPASRGGAESSSERFRTYRMSQQENRYYGLIWGIDSPRVSVIESGELVRFSYSVMDPDKAKTLNDVKLQPTLEAPRANVKLVVPQLEKVGMLRQSSTPVAGKSYWMAFSNKGGVVRRGDRVNIVIGSFRADGLVVE